MTDSVRCWRFACKNPRCKLDIWLPEDELSRLALDPENPPDVYPSIALQCHYCKQIHRYSLLPSSSDRIGEDLVSPDHREGLDFVFLLRCREVYCRPLPLIETWSNAKSAEGQYAVRLANAQHRKWESLTCVKGHPIPYQQM